MFSYFVGKYIYLLVSNESCVVVFMSEYEYSPALKSEIKK